MRAPSTSMIALALIAYSAVMVSLTMLKSFFVIGLLWVPEAHRNRSISLVPFNDFIESSSWFSPLFGYGGNFAFFVPFGVLFYVLLKTSGSWHKNSVVHTMRMGALFSLTIEISQYVFMLGYSDIDDLIFNTLGAGAGALIAKIFGERFFKVWVWLALILAVVFAVLVALGPRLGDPDKVVDLGQAQRLSVTPMNVFV
ncbi:VanZ family protein [Corynebacterium glutamicum]|uniref:VanZ family protein n=1 Tax=Corynebacterium glutamicum TaxID=1718 RepID=UPI001B8DA1A7|nr:VanZ family protein [Corynebacterium glutamicum]